MREESEFSALVKCREAPKFRARLFLSSPLLLAEFGDYCHSEIFSNPSISYDAPCLETVYFGSSAKALKSCTQSFRRPFPGVCMRFGMWQQLIMEGIQLLDFMAKSFHSSMNREVINSR